MVILCKSNCGNKAILKRPKTGDALCKECFFNAFELEIHETIVRSNLFQRGEKVAIAASGGNIKCQFVCLFNNNHNIF
jgi:cytoplasmic tRNA 2-thiolation protein 1